MSCGIPLHIADYKYAQIEYPLSTIHIKDIITGRSLKIHRIELTKKMVCLSQLFTFNILLLVKDVRYKIWWANIGTKTRVD